MTIYAIHPGSRLVARLKSVLQADLIPLTAFSGVSLRNDISFADTALPFISIEIAQSEEKPQGSGIWHVGLSVVMGEDREEAQLPLEASAPDTRPRHELRLENLTTRLLGTWDGETLIASLNGTASTQGLACIKAYGQGINHDSASEGVVYTQAVITIICGCTTQE